MQTINSTSQSINKSINHEIDKSRCALSEREVTVFRALYSMHVPKEQAGQVSDAALFYIACSEA